MKKLCIFTVLNIAMVIFLILMTIYCTNFQDSMTICVYFGESHMGQKNIAQLYYSDDEKNLKKNSPITITFEDNVVSFPVGKIDFKKNIVRLDPFNKKENFSIQRLEVAYGEKIALSLSGQELENYIKKTPGLKCEVNGTLLDCTAKNDNPRFVMKKSFSDRINRYYLLINVAPYILMVLIYLAVAFVEVKYLAAGKGKSRFGVVLSMLVLCLGSVSIYAFEYFEKHFGQVPFGQLVYHLHTPLEGTDISSYQDVILLGAVGAAFIAVLFYGIYRLLRRKQAHRGFLLWGGFLGLLLLAYSGVKMYIHFDIAEYYKYTHSNTTLYEEYYVDGREVDITFPEKKRNLIYIFLESMEITYADTASGGAMQENYIPELAALALENNCFSDGTKLNGAYHVSGATYTMGALAAQTGGVPINETLVSNDTLNGTWESENNYLPGVWSIGDVLQEAGYNQEFLIGSNGGFAGRSSYFKGHGGYDVEDYQAAIEKGRIPADYKVWWGYEDEKLFAFAKEDILKLAEQDEPFNFTMLTVDSHFTDGYRCELCEEQFPAQYSNVMACSSRQVAAFIHWIQEQDFYENTTIILAGDHLTPDSYYIANEGAAGYDRKTYFAVINPAEGKSVKNRERSYTILDLYPTALSGMGVSIEGSRLGLGVDLYSEVPTLAEEYGMEYLNGELQKNSKYYTEKLLYK